ncbi:EAL domain-containing protein [Rahnella sikkimica]|nr:EAL domain-containing protein [Rahnella sikkimica]
MMLRLNFQVSCKFRCEPIYSIGGSLHAVEVLTSFEGGYAGGKMEPQKFISSLDTKSKRELLLAQLTEINAQSLFFKNNKLLCSLNIDQSMAIMILEDHDVQEIIEKNDFIRLEISERFPKIDKTEGNIILDALAEKYELWLDDYGTDFSNINTLKNTKFESVKIDKKFFWENGNSVMWASILDNISQHCASIIVEGVETGTQLRSLKYSGVSCVQGFLFPSVPLDDIEILMPKKGYYNL